MDWCEVRIAINQEAAEAAINILQDYGGRGVITEDFKKDIQRQIITVYFPDDEKFKDTIAEIKKKINNLINFNLTIGKVNYTIKLCKDRNWNESWYKYFKPTPAGENFVFCPSWDNYYNNEKIVIKIDPGQAFGTGVHATTRLAVRLMEKYIGNKAKKIDNMLDIGTGTAILSIVAARLGVKNIIGIDNNRAAIRAAHKNIKVNNVSDFVTIKESNLFSEISCSFSLVTINILPNIILKILADLADYVEDNGIVILSAINDKYEREILKKLKQGRFTVLEKIVEDDWKALAAQKG